MYVCIYIYFVVVVVNTDSKIHRLAEASRALWRTLLQQEHPQQGTQHHILAASEDLRGRHPPQPLWAAHARAPLSHHTQVFAGVQREPPEFHCLWSCHCVPLKGAWLWHLYFLTSGIYIHINKIPPRSFFSLGYPLIRTDAPVPSSSLWPFSGQSLQHVHGSHVQGSPLHGTAGLPPATLLTPGKDQGREGEVQIR